MAAYKLREPAGAVFLFLFVGDMEDTVGAADQKVAFLQLQRPPRVIRLGKQADHRAAFLQQFDRAVSTANQNRRLQTGVDVLEHILPRVHQAEKDAKVLARSRIPVKHFVERKGQDFKRVQVQNQRPQRGLQVGHDQRRRNALAFDLSNHDQQRVRSQLEKVIVV